MIDNVGLRYPHRASGAKAPRTLRPLPLLRFAVSATGGAHLCSIQYAVRLIKALYGIDMEQTQYSKLISDIPEPDIAISMGCNVGCPFIGRPFDDNWELEDPTGKSDEEFKKVIDEIRVRIMELKQRLGKNIEA